MKSAAQILKSKPGQAVETVTPSTSVLDAVKLIGLISIGDLVKDIISEQKFIVEQLEHYIKGDRG